MEFAFQRAIHEKRGIHRKDVEFTEMAWNSRYAMESAGVVLVMWGVASLLGNRNIILLRCAA